MKRFVKRLAQKVAKLSDEQLERLVQSLVEENDTLDAVMESLSTGLLICDTDFNLLLANKAAERLVPFNANRAGGIDQREQKIPVWNIIADEDISAFLRTVHQKQKSHASEEFTLETAGGSVRIIVVSAMPLVQKKRMIGVIVQLDDVTERRSQQTLLRRMESLASLTNLAASVAHEIKNPLGAISIHIQLIQKALKKAREGDGMLPEAKFAEDYLKVVNEEIDRLNKIIVDFLFAVRPIQAKPEPADPNEIVAALMDFMKPELGKASVALRLELWEKSPKLMLDVSLFKQVVINLVQNALAAMKGGGILGIRTAVKDERFILTVADTGEGMDERTCSRVFEPYFTTKANGTGLGLTMAYKIIKESAGEIAVRSFPGKGTIFTISLPIPQKERRSLAYKAEGAAAGGGGGAANAESFSESESPAGFAGAASAESFSEGESSAIFAGASGAESVGSAAGFESAESGSGFASAEGGGSAAFVVGGASGESANGASAGRAARGGLESAGCSAEVENAARSGGAERAADASSAACAESEKERQ